MSLAAAMTTIAANLYKVTGRSYTTVDGCTRAQVLTGIDTVATLRFALTRTTEAGRGERLDSIHIPYVVATTALTGLTAALSVVDYTAAGEVVTPIATTNAGFTLTVGNKVGTMTVDAPAYDNDADQRLFQLVLTLSNTNATASNVTFCAVEANHTVNLMGATTNMFAVFIPDANQQTIAAGAGGAINVTSFYTDISTDAGGDAFTLANGTVVGQLKHIRLTTDGGGDGVVTGTFSGGTTLTFNDANDEVFLMWNGAAWRAVELFGVALT